MEIINKLIYAEPHNAAAKSLLADIFEQLGYQYESSSMRNSFLSAAQELRSGIASNIGVETGGTEQQAEHWAQKLLGFEQTREVFHTCRRLGIKTRGYFVVGVPGDTAESLKETIRWARALRPTTLQFLPYRELPAKLDEYTIVDEAVLRSIKRAYLAYYLTPANLLGQLLQPKLFTNRIKRFFSLRRA